MSSLISSITTEISGIIYRSDSIVDVNKDIHIKINVKCKTLIKNVDVVLVSEHAILERTVGQNGIDIDAPGKDLDFNVKWNASFSFLTIGLKYERYKILILDHKSHQLIDESDVFLIKLREFKKDELMLDVCKLVRYLFDEGSESVKSLAETILKWSYVVDLKTSLSIIIDSMKNDQKLLNYENNVPLSCRIEFDYCGEAKNFVMGIIFVILAKSIGLLPFIVKGSDGVIVGVIPYEYYDHFYRCFGLKNISDITGAIIIDPTLLTSILMAEEIIHKSEQFDCGTVEWVLDCNSGKLISGDDKETSLIQKLVDTKVSCIRRAFINLNNTITEWKKLLNKNKTASSINLDCDAPSNDFESNCFISLNLSTLDETLRLQEYLLRHNVLFIQFDKNLINPLIEKRSIILQGKMKNVFENICNDCSEPTHFKLVNGIVRVDDNGYMRNCPISFIDLNVVKVHDVVSIQSDDTTFKINDELVKLSDHSSDLLNRLKIINSDGIVSYELLPGVVDNGLFLWIEKTSQFLLVEDLQLNWQRIKTNNVLNSYLSNRTIDSDVVWDSSQYTNNLHGNYSKDLIIALNASISNISFVWGAGDVDVNDISLLIENLTLKNKTMLVVSNNIEKLNDLSNTLNNFGFGSLTSNWVSNKTNTSSECSRFTNIYDDTIMSTLVQSTNTNLKEIILKDYYEELLTRRQLENLSLYDEILSCIVKYGYKNKNGIDNVDLDKIVISPEYEEYIGRKYLFKDFEEYEVIECSEDMLDKVKLYLCSIENLLKYGKLFDDFSSVSVINLLSLTSFIETYKSVGIIGFISLFYCYPKMGRISRVFDLLKSSVGDELEKRVTIVSYLDELLLLIMDYSKYLKRYFTSNDGGLSDCCSIILKNIDKINEIYKRLDIDLIDIINQLEIIGLQNIGDQDNLKNIIKNSDVIKEEYTIFTGIFTICNKFPGKIKSNPSLVKSFIDCSSDLIVVCRNVKNVSDLYNIKYENIEIIDLISNYVFTFRENITKHEFCDLESVYSIQIKINKMLLSGLYDNTVFSNLLNNLITLIGNIYDKLIVYNADLQDCLCFWDKCVFEYYPGIIVKTNHLSNLHIKHKLVSYLKCKLKTKLTIKETTHLLDLVLHDSDILLDLLLKLESELTSVKSAELLISISKYTVDSDINTYDSFLDELVSHCPAESEILEFDKNISRAEKLNKDMVDKYGYKKIFNTLGCAVRIISHCNHLSHDIDIIIEAVNNLKSKCVTDIIKCKNDPNYVLCQSIVRNNNLTGAQIYYLLSNIDNLYNVVKYYSVNHNILYSNSLIDVDIDLIMLQEIKTIRNKISMSLKKTIIYNEFKERLKRFVRPDLASSIANKIVSTDQEKIIDYIESEVSKDKIDKQISSLLYLDFYSLNADIRDVYQTNVSKLSHKINRNPIMEVCANISKNVNYIEFKNYLSHHPIQNNGYNVSNLLSNQPNTYLSATPIIFSDNRSLLKNIKNNQSSFDYVLLVDCQDVPIYEMIPSIIRGSTIIIINSSNFNNIIGGSEDCNNLQSLSDFCKCINIPVLESDKITEIIESNTLIDIDDFTLIVEKELKQYNLNVKTNVQIGKTLIDLAVFDNDMNISIAIYLDKTTSVMICNDIHENYCRVIEPLIKANVIVLHFGIIQWYKQKDDIIKYIQSVLNSGSSS